MALELFEFQEQFIIDTFLIKLTQLGPIGSTCNFFSAGKPEN